MSLRKEILEKLSTLITAAFGLVAALAWNSAIQAAFERYVAARFGEGGQLGAMFAYAVLATITAVAATLWVGRAVARVGDLKFPPTWGREMQPPPG